MSLMYFLLLKCRLHGIHDTLGPYSDPCGTAPKGTVGAGALCVVTTVGVAARGTALLLLPPRRDGVGESSKCCRGSSCASDCGEVVNCM